MKRQLTPQEMFNLGAKYKKAGIIIAILGLLAVVAGSGLFVHGRNLQLHAQSDARASGFGTLTITMPTKPVKTTPLGGSSDGSSSAGGK